MKLTEWEDGNNHWHCGDVSDLGNDSNVWYRVPRILNIALDDFIKMLTDKFEVDYIHWNEKSGVLSFYWIQQTKMRKYKNWVNRELRRLGV